MALGSGDEDVKRRDFLKGVALAAVAAPAAGRSSVGAPSAPEAPGLTYARTLPVKVETDVFVAGGGPAGVAAAVAARSAGARVFMAEGFTCFGGMGTAGRVPLFMQFGDGIRDLAQGFGTRFRARLKREGAMPGSGDAFDFEAVKRAYDAEMQECGADFLFQSRVIDVTGMRLTPQARETDRSESFWSGFSSPRASIRERWL